MHKYLFILGLIWSQYGMTKSIILPFIINDYNSPIITLTLAGKETTLMLDTGSQQGLHLPKSLMEHIPTLHLLNSSKQSIDLAGNKLNDQAFIIDEITLAGMPFHHIHGVEYSPWGYSLDYHHDPSHEPEKQAPPPDYPVIGLGLFYQHQLIIDYAQHQLIITDDSEKQSHTLEKGWLTLPFILTEEGIIISVTDGRKNYHLALDSGASHSIIRAEVTQQVVNKPCDNNHLEIICPFVALTLTAYPKQLPTIDAMRLAQPLPKEFQADGLLGADFFEQFMVFIDQQNKQLKIKPITKEN